MDIQQNTSKLRSDVPTANQILRLVSEIDLARWSRQSRNNERRAWRKRTTGPDMCAAQCTLSIGFPNQLSIVFKALEDVWGFAIGAGGCCLYNKGG